jgi:hypothetical protein
MSSHTLFLPSFIWGRYSHGLYININTGRNCVKDEDSDQAVNNTFHSYLVCVCDKSVNVALAQVFGHIDNMSILF